MEVGYEEDGREGGRDGEKLKQARRVEGGKRRGKGGKEMEG